MYTFTRHCLLCSSSVFPVALVKKETGPSAAVMEQPGRDPEENNTTAQVESSERGSTEKDAQVEQRTADIDTPAEQSTQNQDSSLPPNTSSGQGSHNLEDLDTEGEKSGMFLPQTMVPSNSLILSYCKS